MLSLDDLNVKSYRLKDFMVHVENKITTGTSLREVCNGNMDSKSN